MRVAVALVVAVLLGLLLGLYVSPLRQRKATPVSTTTDRPAGSAESNTCREHESCIACTEGVTCPCPNHSVSGNVIYGCKHNGVPRCAGVCWSLAISSVGDDLYD